mmetsp:Transcript_52564/g.77894  ORF Transcript_52564/g.77894 Transcript_52564/m.77894 type:complete len:170 (-) Transcript_52564:367-876(-)
MIVKISFKTPPIISTIAEDFIISDSSHKTIAIAIDAPPKAKASVTPTMCHESRNGPKTFQSSIISDVKIRTKNILGDNTLMVAMAVLSGGSKFFIFNCTSVHRNPPHMLALKTRNKPVASKLIPSPKTVKHSPAEMTKTTKIKPQVIGSNPNTKADITTNIGAEALTIV